MRKTKWKFFWGIGLLSLSFLIYGIHFILFGDYKQIFNYLISNIAFIPIEVLIVTFIIKKLLDEREKKAVLQKLNMIIGTFFSELGNDLVELCGSCDDNIDELSPRLIIPSCFTEKDFRELHKQLKKHKFSTNINKVDLLHLKAMLHSKRSFMITMLANPVLLEHESFTELLRAVFHLEEELSRRKDLKNLSKTDLEHLQFDIFRMYKLLLHEWVDYIKYLKEEYPYLFSFAMRTNPFDKSVSAELEE